MAAGKNSIFVGGVGRIKQTLIGEMRTDIIVDTTINLQFQKLAGSIISKTLEKSGDSRAVSQGAMVAMTPDGFF